MKRPSFTARREAQAGLLEKLEAKASSAASSEEPMVVTKMKSGSSSRMNSRLNSSNTLGFSSARLTQPRSLSMAPVMLSLPLALAPLE